MVVGGVQGCVCEEMGVTVCDSTHNGGRARAYAHAFVSVSSSGGETECNRDSDISNIAIKQSHVAW